MVPLSVSRSFADHRRQRLAALTYARSTDIAKDRYSLLGGQIRRMGWTLTTAMWRNRDPVAGQARVTEVDYPNAARD